MSLHDPSHPPFDSLTQRLNSLTFGHLALKERHRSSPTDEVLMLSGLFCCATWDYPLSKHSEGRNSPSWFPRHKCFMRIQEKVQEVNKHFDLRMLCHWRSKKSQTSQNILEAKPFLQKNTPAILQIRSKPVAKYDALGVTIGSRVMQTITAN